MFSIIYDDGRAIGVYPPPLLFFPNESMNYAYMHDADKLFSQA